MTLYEKMHEIMKNVQYLAKDDRVKFGSTDYKVLSEEKVTTVMREQLEKYKLLVFPVAQSFSRSGQLSHVDVQYKLLNVENPEEYEIIASCGDGADSQDKGAGKAMTYAFKYMWLRTFAIPTGEDPDKISSEEITAKQQEEAKTQVYECAICGNPIKDYTAPNGATISAKRHAEGSLKKFGQVLCLNCIDDMRQMEGNNA